jgi:pimeloyl-ACP methyl ester carboxylesterase
MTTTAAEARDVELRSGRRVHVIESGEGTPVLFLHGSGTSSVSLGPILEHLENVRAVAVDRPGFGLSEPASVPRERFRDFAIEFVDEVLDALALEATAIAGNSMGGTWALWYALARPERVRRLVLLGSAPLLPGTSPPAPLRVTATPVAGELLTRLVKPNPQRLVRLMDAMGERGTIVRYPDLIEALVAGAGDPTASTANIAELRAVISPLGFRGRARMSIEELRRVSVATLLVWGDRDPVGSVEAARAVAAAIPEARLEILPAGHVPYLGHPERAAELLSAFVR